MDVQTFCRVCNAMCGLVVTVEDEVITKIRGDESHALSRGYTCAKGRSLGVLHHDDRRLDQPSTGRGHSRTLSEWEHVLDDIADRVSASLNEFGPDSIAMYLASGSAFDTAGRRSAERFLSLLESKQKYTATTIDTPSKPLIAELIGGWSGLTPLWDHESSKLLLLFGSNPVVSHGHSNAMPDPVRRFREFQEGGGALWVIDPRRTETATLADRHLQIRPGSDWLVLGWLVRRLLEEHPAASTLDQRATGAESLKNSVAAFDDQIVATSCDVAIDSLEALLDAVLSAGRVSALTGTGVSMSATANVTEYLLWALHIVTDSYDAPGGMWFNPGYLLRLDQRDLPVSDGTPAPGPKSRPDLPRRFGEYPCSALVPEIEAGNITTLIVVGGNPVTALPDRDRTIAALSSLSTLVVIDVLPTETTDLASHVLPAVDQLERADLTWLLDSFQLAVAAQFTKAVVQPLHERRPVWWMLAQLANRLELDLLPRDVELNDETETRLLMHLVDRSLDPQSLMSSPSLTIASGAVYGWVAARVLSSGKWRLGVPALQADIAHLLKNPPQQGSSVLLPSRRLKLMNSQFREIVPPGGTLEQPAIYASPSAVAALGRPERATVTSPFGSVTARLLADPTLRDDSIVLTHGWGDANVCALTSAATGIDSLTGMVLQSGLEVELQAAD